MKKDKDCRIIRLGDRILRILDAEGEKALVIDCVKMGMPKWISLSEIEDGVEIPGEEFMGEMERDIPEGMSASARQTMHVLLYQGKAEPFHGLYPDAEREVL